MGCCNSKKKKQAEEDRQKQREADEAAAKKQHKAEEEALKKDLHKADDIDMLAHEIAVDYVADHLGKNEISAEHAQDLVKEYKEEEQELKELAEREKELEAEKEKLANEQDVAEYAGVRLADNEQKLKEIADEEEIIKWQLEEDRARQHEIYEELKDKHVVNVQEKVEEIETKISQDCQSPVKPGRPDPDLNMNVLSLEEIRAKLFELQADRDFLEKVLDEFEHNHREESQSEKLEEFEKMKVLNKRIKKYKDREAELMALEAQERDELLRREASDQRRARAQEAADQAIEKAKQTVYATASLSTDDVKMTIQPQPEYSPTGQSVLFLDPSMAGKPLPNWSTGGQKYTLPNVQVALGNSIGAPRPEGTGGSSLTVPPQFTYIGQATLPAGAPLPSAASFAQPGAQVSPTPNSLSPNSMKAVYAQPIYSPRQGSPVVSLPAYDPTEAYHYSLNPQIQSIYSTAHGVPLTNTQSQSYYRISPQATQTQQAAMSSFSYSMSSNGTTTGFHPAGSIQGHTMQPTGWTQMPQYIQSQTVVSHQPPVNTTLTPGAVASVSAAPQVAVSSSAAVQQVVTQTLTPSQVQQAQAPESSQQV